MNQNGNAISSSSPIDNSYNMELDAFIEKLRKCEYIQDDKSVKTLCDKAKEILSKEENVIYLSTPITVTHIQHITYMYLIDMRRHSWTVLRFN
jgi:hypothetical protein